MTRRCIFLVAVALTIFPARADFYDGLDAFDRGDYETAIREWAPLASAGDAEAQYRLARLYQNADAPYEDPERSRSWYAAAAESGHAQAQNNLGLVYELGVGGESDPELAVRWYRAAAERDLVPAQHNLARMYATGSGVERDAAEAAEWYRRAADAGYPKSRYELGRMYLDGVGVEKDPGRAAEWLRRAAKQDHPEAQFELARLYREGLGVPRDSKKARKWSARAAEHGLYSAPDARFVDLGGRPRGAVSVTTMTDDPPAPAPEPDRDAEEDVDEAPSKGTRPRDSVAPEVGPGRSAAADPEERSRPTLPPRPAPVAAPTETPPTDPEEAYRMGRRFEIGDGAPQDPARAEQFLLAAARSGHGLAAYRLGFLYWRGRGESGSRDAAAAHAWFRIAAIRGVGDAAEWETRVERAMSKRERRAAEENFALWESAAP